MQKINDIYRDMDATMIAECSWKELHSSFQQEYEKFLQDTGDEIMERTQRLNELKNYRDSLNRSKFMPLKNTIELISSR